MSNREDSPGRYISGEICQQIVEMVIIDPYERSVRPSFCIDDLTDCLISHLISKPNNMLGFEPFPIFVRMSLQYDI